MEEIFKIYKIVYSNRYEASKRVWEVSNLGRVKCNGKLLEPYMHNRYMHIGSFNVHNAVAELFVPNPDNKPQIDHIDGDTTNNAATNLRWVTQLENNQNIIRRERISSKLSGRTLTEEHKRKISETKKRGK